MLNFSNIFLKAIVLVLVRPFLWLIATKQEVCAEHMLFAMLDAKTGMYRRDEKGNDIGMKGFPLGVDAGKLLWNHTRDATDIPS